MLLFFNEIALLEERIPDEYDQVATQNIKTALGQLEYLQIHSSFKNVKKSLIENFIANQDADLKNHIKDRSLSLLRLAKQYEDNNQRGVLNQFITTVKTELDKIQASPSAEIVESSFQSALKGIKAGKMTYEGDKVLPFIQSKIQENIQSFKKLTPQE